MAKRQAILGAAGAAGGVAIGAPVGGMGLALMGTAIAIPAVVPPLDAGGGRLVCRPAHRQAPRPKSPNDQLDVLLQDTGPPGGARRGNAQPWRVTR